VIVELKDLHMLERKVMTALKESEQSMKRRYIRKSNDLAGRLDTVDFGPRNTALDETKLKEFVQNTDTFQWFNERFPQIAESMQRGLDERTRPRLDEESRKFQELEERLHRARLEGRRAAEADFEKWGDDMWGRRPATDVSSTAPQRSNPTVANTGSCCCCVPTIQKRPNPTVANEKSNKKAKNEL
ncbi:hypothetical protein HK104_006381, partial [Borealophlyctis nickersoniae]